MTNTERATYWLKGSGEEGDGMHASFSSFWKMLCYKDTDEPVNGNKVKIDYQEYSERG